MRKRLIASVSQGSEVAAENQSWLDLASMAVVEITSEEKEFPIESALLPGEQRGWRAAVSGSPIRNSQSIGVARSPLSRNPLRARIYFYKFFRL